MQRLTRLRYTLINIYAKFNSDDKNKEDIALIKPFNRLNIV